MIVGLLLIIGSYGLCAVLVHIGYLRERKTGIDRTVHLVLITRNNEAEIEWYLRSYLFFSWLRGRPSAINVFDDGSADETCEIIIRIARERPCISLHPTTNGLDSFLEEHDDQPLYLLHLDRMDLSPKQTLFKW